MKFTAISDLHGYLPKYLPGGDVLCICGDIVPLDYQNDFTQSVAWYRLSARGLGRSVIVPTERLP